MLGEKLGSIQDGTTNKTLPVEGSLPKFETTTEGSGTLAGAEVTIMNRQLIDVVTARHPQTSPNYLQSFISSCERTSCVPRSPSYKSRSYPS